MIAEQDDDRASMAAIQAGAQDYIVKGMLCDDLLDRALRYAFERYRLVHELKRQRQLVGVRAGAFRARSV